MEESPETFHQVDQQDDLSQLLLSLPDSKIRNYTIECILRGSNPGASNAEGARKYWPVKAKTQAC